LLCVEADGLAVWYDYIDINTTEVEVEEFVVTKDSVYGHELSIGDRYINRFGKEAEILEEPQFVISGGLPVLRWSEKQGDLTIAVSFGFPPIGNRIS